MIKIKDVSIELGGNWLFEGVDFIINPKDKIGLIGRNGCGKSTFFKLLLKEIEPEGGTIDIPEGYRIGHLAQHLKFEHSSVIDEVCSVLPPERDYEYYKGEEILFGLGFNSETIHKNPQELSGGWQVKLNLAKLLLQEPDLLLLDEPTNYLDIYAIRWLGDFLKKWQGEMILITHDRHFMNSVINHSLIIHRGYFRKVKGTAEKIKKQIEVEEEIYEKNRLTHEKKRKELQEWIAKFRSKSSKAGAVSSREKMLEKTPPKEKLMQIKNLDFDFAYCTLGSATEIITVDNLTFGYNKESILIKDLSFKVEQGDKICIIGKNGNGKSTLLRLLAGEIEQISGTIKKNEKIELGYFGQMNKDRMTKTNNVAQEIKTANPILDEQSIRRVCAQMLFNGDLAYKKIEVLSGGEKSRVMLGKIILKPSNVLFLDEPTNHLDIESCEALGDAIKNFKGTVLMVSHDEYFLEEIANKLIVFDAGKVFFFNGGYNEFLKKIGWKDEVNK